MNETQERADYERRPEELFRRQAQAAQDHYERLVPLMQQAQALSAMPQVNGLGHLPGSPSIDKAEGLLKERLGPRWRLFQETGKLMESSRLWRDVAYYLGRRQPVKVFHAAELVVALCVLNRRGEPEADRLMTILDLIQTDERRLWEMANLSIFTTRFIRGEIP